MKKRILAIVMSVIMTIGLLPETNYAQEVNSAVTPAASNESSTGVATPENGTATEVATPENGSEAVYTYGTGLVQRQPEQIRITGEDTDACGTEDSTGVRAYDSEWDKYASNYYYNQLTADEKVFYNNLDALCFNYLKNQDNIVGYYYSDMGIHYSDGVDYGQLEFNSDSMEHLANSQVAHVFWMFKYANPQYYFIGNTFAKTLDYQGNLRFRFHIYNDFINGTARKNATTQLESAVKGMVDKMPKNGDKLALEKSAHDQIINKVYYDQGDINSISYEETAYTQSAYSVFCGNKTVCAGYSLAFEMLCNAVGIDSIAVLSIGHAWNMVRQNGSWYYVDCTWDDPVTHDGSNVLWYRYFNRNKMKILNELDENSAHVAEDFLTGYLPNCVNDSSPKDDFSIGMIANAGGTAATPTISVDTSGILTIASGQAGAKFYYTVDGTNPSVSITKCSAYSTPVKITQTANVRAIASYDGYNDSSIVGAGFNTVTFDSKGGTSVAPQSVVTGSLLKQPAKPTKSGYTLVGWVTDSGSMWNFSTNTVTTNMTLHAKWGKTYKIKYNLNGGKQNKLNPSKYTPITETFTLQKPTRKGYTFGGWFRNSNLTAKVTKVKKGTKVNLTFYAKWNKVNVAKGTVKSLKNKTGKSMAVTVAKVSGVAGYQIQYSTKANMKSAKSVKITTTSTTIKGLTKKKTYYVQIRPYKLDSTKNKVYGAWSGIKSVKIKK